MTDPCMGHECDQCPRCAKGRCCRRDNAGYQLPELGSWQPVYGELGVRNTDGTRMECHACGGWFVSIGSHSWAAHDLTAREYKAAFGLTNAGLMGERFRDEIAGDRRERWAAGIVVLTPGTGVTREQHRSARRSLEGQRISAAIAREHLLPASHTEAVVERMRATRRAQSEATLIDVACVVCGAISRVQPYQKRPTCGRPECVRQCQSDMAKLREVRHPELARRRGLAVAAASRAMWADPERRAKMLAAREVGNERRKRRVTKACEVCGKSFEVTASRAAEATCCSLRCAGIRRARLRLTCHGHSDASRARMSDARRQWWAAKRAAS